MVRIALVTGRRAAEQLKTVARRIAERTGWKVDVIVAHTEVAALIPREELERIMRENMGRYDIFIVPGRLEYSVEEVAEETGASIVRGPDDASALLLLAELGEEGLERLRHEGKFSPTLLLDRMLRELAEHHRAAPGVNVCGVKVPVRPPPIVLAAELYLPSGGGGVEEAVEKAAVKARELLSHGADILVVGFGPGWGRDETLQALEELRARLGIPVAVDTPDVEAAAEAASRGLACMYMSLGLWNLDKASVLPRGLAAVATPVMEGLRLPSTPLERLEAVKKVVKAAEEAGLRPIVDPVVDPPGQGSMGLSVSAYYLVSHEITDKPLMAGLANVYELLDADTHGQIAVLMQLYAEAGASIMLVTEESRKAYMAVAEARIAATMTSLSLLGHRLPKDLGVDLLYVKEKRPQPPPSGLPRRPRLSLAADALASWHGFRRDLTGSHLIVVEDGEIRDYYIGRKGTILLRGRSGERLYKAAAYLGLAAEPSHYAYLGYELCKAQHALEMGRSYRQEAPLITPPWRRGQPVYLPRRMGAEKLDSRVEKE